MIKGILPYVLLPRGKIAKCQLRIFFSPLYTYRSEAWLSNMIRNSWYWMPLNNYVRVVNGIAGGSKHGRCIHRATRSRAGSSTLGVAGPLLLHTKHPCQWQSACDHIFIVRRAVDTSSATGDHHRATVGGSLCGGSRPGWSHSVMPLHLHGQREPRRREARERVRRRVGRERHGMRLSAYPPVAVVHVLE